MAKLRSWPPQLEALAHATPCTAFFLLVLSMCRNQHRRVRLHRDSGGGLCLEIRLRGLMGLSETRKMASGQFSVNAKGQTAYFVPRVSFSRRVPDPFSVRVKVQIKPT